MSGATPTEEGDGSASLGGRLEEICDRFEAAWKAGERPTIEDYLGELPEADQTALFRELLVLELTYRRRLGERPTQEGYQCRFPEQVAVINAVFGAEPPLRAARPRAGADHNLLFGLLALQNNFIDRDTLVAAFAAWVTDKPRDLGRILLERGAVDADTHALLEALARKHLQVHRGDLEESLAALARSDRSARIWKGSPTPSCKLVSPASPRPTTGRARTPRPRGPRRPVPRVHGSASCGCTGPAAWAPSTSPATKSCTARWP